MTKSKCFMEMKLGYSAFFTAKTAWFSAEHVDDA